MHDVPLSQMQGVYVMVAYGRLREAHLSVTCQECGAGEGVVCRAPTGEAIPQLHQSRVIEGNRIYLEERKHGDTGGDQAGTG